MMRTNSHKEMIIAIGIGLVWGCEGMLSDKTSRQSSNAYAIVTDDRPNSDDATASEDPDKQENKGEVDASDSDDAGDQNTKDPNDNGASLTTVTVVATSTVTVTATSTDTAKITCVVAGPKPDTKALDPTVLATCNKIVLVQIQCNWIPPSPKGCQVYKKQGIAAISNGQTFNCRSLQNLLIDGLP